MTDPERLLAGEADDFERSLLRSARRDGPSPEARKKTLAALGIGVWLIKRRRNAMIAIGIIITAPFARVVRAAVLALALIAAAPGQATPKQDIAGKRQQAQAARAELAKLGAELEPAIERYNKAVVELERVNERIAFNKRQIRVTQQNLKVAQGELNDRLEQAYRAGDLDLDRERDLRRLQTDLVVARLERQRARGYVRGILTQAVTREKRRLPALRRQQAVRGDARRQDRRLRVLGQFQLFVRPLEAQLGKRESKRVIRFFKNASSLWERLRQRLAHTGELRTLSREQKCGLHVLSRF